MVGLVYYDLVLGFAVGLCVFIVVIVVTSECLVGRLLLWFGLLVFVLLWVFVLL